MYPCSAVQVWNALDPSWHQKAVHQDTALGSTGTAPTSHVLHHGIRVCTMQMSNPPQNTATNYIIRTNTNITNNTNHDQQHHTPSAPSAPPAPSAPSSIVEPHSCASWCTWVPATSWQYTSACSRCGGHGPVVPNATQGACMSFCQWVPMPSWESTPDCSQCAGPAGANQTANVPNSTEILP